MSAVGRIYARVEIAEFSDEEADILDAFGHVRPGAAGD